MAKDKAIVLNSGGLNSAVVTSIAVKEQTVALLHVHYGHRAADKEKELFERQANFFETRERLIVEMPHFAAMGGNARVNRKRLIEDALAVGEGPSNCNVPGLMGALLTAGFTWASTIGAKKVILGISQDLGPPAPRTCSIYPEYSLEFIQLWKHLLAEICVRKEILVETPIIDLGRTEIVKIGHRLSTPFEDTWSCLSSGVQPCGACVGCATRNRGFLDAAIPDPVVLAAAHH